MNKLIKHLVAIIAAISILAGCGTSTSATGATDATTAVTVTNDASDATTSATDADASDSSILAATTEENAEPHAATIGYDESSAVQILLGATITANSDAVTIDGTTATITEAGAYELSGTLADGAIIIDADDGAVVQIILDGADITNTTGAAIAFMNAETAIVTLADDSSNTLTDGDLYVLAEGEDEPNATLFSKADLTVGGTGSLTVSANHNDGIASKDGLIITSGAITIDAVDDAIRGKDYVVIEGGQIDITAGGDGIKSDNDEDPERGYIAIANGVIQVTAEDDGVQAATDALISGGTINISAGATGESESARAIVGDVLVSISGGTITAEATDDAIHSNSTVVIDDGNVTLAAGDDAIHGDLFVTINGGTIVITESFEGIEAEVITINDGFIDVTSNDDGLNVASADATAVDAAAPTTPDAGTVEPPVVGDEGTRPARGQGGRGGAGGDEGVGEHYIYINGGTILITVTDALAEQGDGIDANGHIEMTGGVVAVSGPTDTRNSAVDYSGGSFVMTGGLFVGTNIDGRNSEGIGTGSTQASLYVTLGSVADAGTIVHIESADGDNVVTFEPANDFDVVVFSSPDLVAGEAYEIYLGGSGSNESTPGIYDTYTPGTLAGNATAA